jgi:hypothetical protein
VASDSRPQQHSEIRDTWRLRCPPIPGDLPQKSLGCSERCAESWSSTRHVAWPSNAWLVRCPQRWMVRSQRRGLTSSFSFRQQLQTGTAEPAALAVTLVDARTGTQRGWSPFPGMLARSNSMSLYCRPAPSPYRAPFSVAAPLAITLSRGWHRLAPGTSVKYIPSAWFPGCHIGVCIMRNSLFHLHAAYSHEKGLSARLKLVALMQKQLERVATTHAPGNVHQSKAEGGEWKCRRAGSERATPVGLCRPWHSEGEVIPHGPCRSTQHVTRQTSD